MQRIAVEYQVRPPRVSTKVVEMSVSELGYTMIREPGRKWRPPRPTEFFGESSSEALAALREALGEVMAVVKLYEEVSKL